MECTSAENGCRTPKDWATLVQVATSTDLCLNYILGVCVCVCLSLCVWGGHLDCVIRVMLTPLSFGVMFCRRAGAAHACKSLPNQDTVSAWWHLAWSARGLHFFRGSFNGQTHSSLSLTTLTDRRVSLAHSFGSTLHLSNSYGNVCAVVCMGAWVGGGTGGRVWAPANACAGPCRRACKLDNHTCMCDDRFLFRVHLAVTCLDVAILVQIQAIRGRLHERIGNQKCGAEARNTNGLEYLQEVDTIANPVRKKKRNRILVQLLKRLLLENLFILLLFIFEYFCEI